MSLLCNLGWHRPSGIPRWNDGYYFSRCGRCGKDLVRTAYGDWRVPKGCRVVWGTERPAGSPSVALVVEEPAAETAQEFSAETAPGAAAGEAEAPIVPETPAAPVEPQEPLPAPVAVSSKGSKRLPIAEVLDLLRAGPEPATVPVPAPAPVPPPAPVEASPAPVARRSTSRWDFMEDSHEHDPVPGVPAAASSPAAAGDTAAPQDPQPALPGPRGPSLQKRAGALLARVRQAGSEAASSAGLRRGVRTAAVLAGLVAVAAAIAFFVNDQRISPPRAATVEEASPAPDPDPFAATASDSTVSSGSTPFFVTASLLSCRSAPARQAPRVRNLARGDEVRILAADGDWVSVAHEGRQCWALGRYLSVSPPF